MVAQHLGARAGFGGLKAESGLSKRGPATGKGAGELHANLSQDLGITCYGCSTAELCLSLCDPMDCNMSGFPVLH